MTENTQNWAGNLTYRAARWHRPETIEQVQEIVARCEKVKVLGTRHSFNEIADTEHDLVELTGLRNVIALNREARTVTVEAGIQYGTLARYLDAEGFALHNLASLPHISVGGACATGTHGSGIGNRNLASQVCALQMVTASGDVNRLARGEAEFDAAVVGVGALGVVTRLTLDIEPMYQMRQVVYERMPLANVLDDYDAVAGAAYSVSLFTDWNGTTINQVWLKHRDEAGTFQLEPTWNGATLATRKMHPIGDTPSENCTEQQGILGPWHERLPHFKMEFTPSRGEELQSEYFVPRSQAVNAIKALFALRDQIAPLILISEVRTIASDGLWLSGAYEQDTVGLHFTWKQDWPGVRAVLPAIEARLLPLGARPHWGKLFTLSAEQVQSAFPRLPDFQRLMQRYDPSGKFQNEFLRTYVAA